MYNDGYNMQKHMKTVKMQYILCNNYNALNVSNTKN